MRILANENFPRQLVDSLRKEGHDVSWIRTEAPGSSDPEVLARAQAEGRIVATFDKDFGELAFHRGLPSTCGILLFRLHGPSPEAVTAQVLAALRRPVEWKGNFAVITPDGIRVRPLHPPA